MLKGRELIIYLTMKYKADWDKVFYAIRFKEPIIEEEAREYLNKITSNVCSILDPEYPDHLKNIYHPPFALFYYGDISLISDYMNCLSVVGSRKMSDYGERVTKQLVGDLSATYTIISGMARGVDAAAHKACIQKGGKTVAVLGSGIDFPYPKSNSDLYEELKKNHLVISEYYGDIQPERENFTWRNRIVAGLSKGLLITEANEYSGTLTTVCYALNSGRDILAVPYPIDCKSACNRLIKEGATLVENAEDVYNNFGDTVK